VSDIQDNNSFLATDITTDRMTCQGLNGQQPLVLPCKLDYKPRTTHDKFVIRPTTAQ